MERERLEREMARSAEDDDQRRRWLRQRERTTTTTTTTTTAAVLLADDGHVNLFPEARDAELDLALGGVGRRTKTPSSLPDVPLGGDEAARRRSGDVPFYMRHGGGGGIRRG